MADEVSFNRSQFQSFEVSFNRSRNIFLLQAVITDLHGAMQGARTDVGLDDQLVALRSEADEIRRLFAFQAEAESLCAEVSVHFFG